jgi:uncharacterized protein YoxC
MSIMEWCWAAAAVAVVVLAGMAARTLATARTALRQAGEAISRMERHLEDTAGQTQQLLQTSNRIATDIEKKLDAAKSVAESVRDMGESLNRVGSTVRKASASLSRSVLEVEQAVHTHRARVQEALEWAATGVELWQRWQAGRNAQARSKGTKTE